MAICGHPYPVEGCHNCWQWLEEWKDELCRENDFHESLLTRLIASGAVTADQIDSIGTELASMEHSARVLVDLCRERDRARSVARRLYHDWTARTVRSLREIGEAEPWILARDESAAAAAADSTEKPAA